MPYRGTADEGFGAVADAFARNFAEGGEPGAAVTVFVDGRKAVDLWAGIADDRTGRAWDERTVTPVMSCAKAVVSACVLLLAEQGRLDLDAPVADCWPRFARHGKEGITPRMVPARTAGIPLAERRLTFEELAAWTPVIEALEEQPPLWEPGTAYEYHAHAFGFLLGEVIRRLTALYAAVATGVDGGPRLLGADTVSRCVRPRPSRAARPVRPLRRPDHPSRRDAAAACAAVRRCGRRPPTAGGGTPSPARR